LIKVLIAEDDKSMNRVLTSELSLDGFDVTATDNGLAAIEMMEKEEYDILLLDLIMPGIGGIEVLKRMGNMNIPTETIVFTGHATVSTAVEAMKLGAYDYLSKPFKIEELKAVLQKAYEKKVLKKENMILRAQVERHLGSPKIITKNPVMLDIMEKLKKIAMSDVPVLICGESGVGKELIARAIYEMGARSGGTLIPVNCGSIPENMLESELFGHEKGAFTGAYARKPGLIEQAHNGILFLDEIGEMSLKLQVKLLRVIEDGTFFRVGGTREIRVDTRFVSATNKDLVNEVDKGNFRLDLYYRISAVTVYVPPLRERRDDIPLLVDFFLKSNQAYRNKRFTDDAIAALCEYAWPGNIRELQNVLHRTLLLAESDVIDSSSLPPDITGGKTTSRRLVDVEREHILKVLRECNGHRGRAAEILGIDPKTLYRKLMLYGVKR